MGENIKKIYMIYRTKPNLKELTLLKTMVFRIFSYIYMLNINP